MASEANEKGMQTIASLLQAWFTYKQASRAMIEAGPLDWPTDPIRDRVQGTGMRFAAKWREAADQVSSLTASLPVLFPEYHVAPKKGEIQDPTSYSQSASIMIRAIPLWLHMLADDVLSNDGDPWGSDRQTDAFNRFFSVAEVIDPQLGDDGDFSLWCLKATEDEMIEEALRIIGHARASQENPR
jgi:hypothetical protein